MADYLIEFVARRAASDPDHRHVLKVGVRDLALDAAKSLSCDEVARAIATADRFFVALDDDVPIEVNVQNCDCGMPDLFAPADGGNAVDLLRDRCPRAFRRRLVSRGDRSARDRATASPRIRAANFARMLDT